MDGVTKEVEDSARENPKGVTRATEDLPSDIEELTILDREIERSTREK